LSSHARHTPLGAIFQNELLLNARRIAPYAMAVVFSCNALLWWGWGAASHYGWATNSEFYIVRNFGGFSFLTLPLFTALIMGDPVIRDFRTGVVPLIFSKPVSRASYLLGKFFGNFFVLVCCQMAFALTLLMLQGFRTSGMIVLPVRVSPYFKHFFFFVVISQLVLAAFYFMVGTLTRNARIVYALAISYYPLYAAYQIVVLRSLPLRWRVALDPLLLNWDIFSRGRSAEWVNQLAVNYDFGMIANRALMILVAATCLAMLCARFSRIERFGKKKGGYQLTTIKLATTTEWIDASALGQSVVEGVRFEKAAREKLVSLPTVGVTTEGVRANLKQLLAAFGIELRLLYSERSIVVFVPLATLLSVAGLASFGVIPESSYSAAYAGRTAESLLLFLTAIAVFYTGEGVHRDRELRFEPVLWSVPAPNCVLLLSKFAATLLLSITLTATVGLAALALQLYQGHTPLEISIYLKTYAVILLPSMVFMIAAATAFNVVLRDKYLAYAISFAVGGALFYLFNAGYNHWLYNPLLYGLWKPSDLNVAGGNWTRILTHRIYTLALATTLLSLAHLFFERKSAKGLRAKARPRGKGWSILILCLSILIAIITGLKVNA
jgi:ABC-2 type transport system permease protein